MTVLFEKDIQRAKKIFDAADPRAVRVIACHHPVFQPKILSRIRPRRLAQEVLNLEPDIILSGHSHLNWIELVNATPNHQVLHISAGSATSNRLRGEVNSFHILEFAERQVKVETYFLEEEGFILKDSNSARTVSFNSHQQVNP